MQRFAHKAKGMFAQYIAIVIEIISLNLVVLWEQESVMYTVSRKNVHLFISANNSVKN